MLIHEFNVPAAAPEKHKRKSAPLPERWMHTRKYALFFCGLFFIAGLVNIFEIPTLASFEGIYKPVYLAVLALATLALGTGAGLIFMMLHSFLDAIAITGLYLIPTLHDRLTDAAILVVMTMIMFIAVRRLQHFRRAFKWATYLSYMCLMPCIIFLILNVPVVTWLPSQTITCTSLISDAVRVRATYERQTFGEKEAAVIGTFGVARFAIAFDGGNTWTDFMVGRQNPCSDPEYGYLLHSGASADALFWYYEIGSVVTTRDGGDSWSLWRGNCPVHSVDYFLQDPYMTMVCGETTYISEDYGDSWHILSDTNERGEDDKPVVIRH